MANYFTFSIFTKRRITATTTNWQPLWSAWCPKLTKMLRRASMKFFESWINEIFVTFCSIFHFKRQESLDIFVGHRDHKMHPVFFRIGLFSVTELFSSMSLMKILENLWFDLKIGFANKPNMICINTAGYAVVNASTIGISIHSSRYRYIKVAQKTFREIFRRWILEKRICIRMFNVTTMAIRKEEDCGF
jgi:hypothetical protein